MDSRTWLRRWTRWRRADWRKRRRIIAYFAGRTAAALCVPAFYPVAYPLALILAARGVRFLSEDEVLPRIGHMALEPDLHLKAMAAGFMPRYRLVVLAPSWKVVNRCLLEYWSRYIRVITNPIAVILLYPLAHVRHIRLPTTLYTLSRGQPVIGSDAIGPVQYRYEGETGGRPLLALTDTDRDRGWRCLRAAGVPEGAWFVCLHVREAGYLPGATHHAYRDASIDTYLEAVRLITDRGGWVVRIGDPTMKQLPPMERVIDYAHSAIRSDWMDVFLCAACRLFIGTTSGLFLVASVFGVPTVLTNFTPMGQRPFASRHRVIYKLYESSIEGRRYLTFAEVLGSAVGRFLASEDYSNGGLEIVDNTPEEIRDVVLEMLEELAGRASLSAEDRDLQDRFNALLPHGPLPEYPVRVGKAFLRKHARLLLPSLASYEAIG